jgi:hypothetical protein
MLDIYILQGRQNGLLVTTDDSSSLGVVASDNSRIRSRGRLVQEDGHARLSDSPQGTR